jgi:glycosyltransferase involved in cell wall biosynthesis
MTRVAWFGPMPPARTGVAGYSRAVVDALRQDFAIEVYVDEPVAAFPRSWAGGATPPAAAPRSAHEFLWRHRLAPYDLTVYQLGNSSSHDFLWPYLFRFPGLTVLHDAQLHHARAAALLRDRRAGDYRHEFAATHPDTSPDMAELAVAGFDSYLYYQLPMTRLVVRASKITAVHAPLSAERLRAENPAARVETIRIGHGDAVSAAQQSAASARMRTEHGIPPDAIIFGVFGGLTPEKRVPQVLEAFASLRLYHPSARLLLAGAPAAHYDLAADIARLGLAGHVHVTGYIEDDRTFTSTVAACDVAVNLRWPTAREVSGPWLQALAAGRATITMDLAHTADVPALDPRSWTVLHTRTSLVPPAAVTVAIDVLDESHSLGLAMRRLAGDGELRARLGRAAAAYWQQHHSLDVMVEDYRRTIRDAIAAPVPAAALPPHLRSDGTERLAALLGPLGIGANVWGRI